jgi:sugar phosphate isomerase/epimerase
MAPRLALSTFAWFNHTIEAACRLTAKLGYEGIEIQGNRPHLNPPDYDEHNVQALRRLLDDLGLVCACVTAFDGTYAWCLSTPNERVYNDTIVHVKQCIDNAAILGAGVVETVTGLPLVVEDDRQSAWSRTRDAYEGIAEYAGTLGVRVGIENEPGNLIDTIDDALRMVHEVHSPHVGFLLDLGHANLDSYCTMADVVHKVAPFVIHMHADDNDGIVHRHLPIGEGTIDWELAFGAIKETGYEGWITVEMEHVRDPMAASHRARRVLSALLR